MNEIKQTLQQDADALLKRLEQSRKNGTGVTLSVSDVGVLCEVIEKEATVFISTDFMIPNDLEKVNVLINSKRLVTDCTFMDGKFYTFPPNSKEEWTEIKNNVTHWMPLPKEPSDD